jgi:hypothetical protein
VPIDSLIKIKGFKSSLLSQCSEVATWRCGSASQSDSY